MWERNQNRHKDLQVFICAHVAKIKIEQRKSFFIFSQNMREASSVQLKAQ